MRIVVLSLSLLTSLASLATPEAPPSSSSSSAPASAPAAEPDDTQAPIAAASPFVASVEVLITKDLIVPMRAKESERSKFSRARMPARERRVRVIDASHTDGAGAAFLTFAIDERYGFGDGGTWATDTIVGCAYPKDGRIFVKSGDSYRPGAALLGKKVKSASAGVCADDGSAPRG